MKKILAIDYGRKRIGLAVSRGSLADPLEILANDATVIDKLKELIISEQVELILVGLSEREMAEETRDFASKIAQQIDLPLEFVDETLSSQRVHQKLAESHMKQSKRQQPIDHFAAAEFLQEWLDTRGAILAGS